MRPQHNAQTGIISPQQDVLPVFMPFPTRHSAVVSFFLSCRYKRTSVQERYEIPGILHVAVCTTLYKTHFAIEICRFLEAACSYTYICALSSIRIFNFDVRRHGSPQRGNKYVRTIYRSYNVWRRDRDPWAIQWSAHKRKKTVDDTPVHTGYVV